MAGRAKHRTAAPGSVRTPAGPDRRGGRRSGDEEPPGAAAGRLRLAVLGLVVLLLAGLVVVLALQVRERSALAKVQRSDGPALTAARDAGRLLFSYDSSQLDADLAAALPLTTAPYTDTYRTAARQVLWPAVTANGSAVVATVRQAGATAATTSTRLVALVLLDRTSRTVDAADPSATMPLDQVQLRMTLVPRGDRWLVSDVQAL